MKVRVGLIGPKDSVEETIKAAEAMSGLEIIPFIYQKTEETETILAENKGEIEQWLFSGPAPYEFALKEKLVNEQEADYIRLHGSSLLGTMLEAVMTEKKVIKRLSVDSIPDEEINQVGRQFNFEGLTIITSSAKKYIPADELISFHESLFQAGEIDAALTCIHSVFIGLREKGIPAYRIKVSELAAHRALSVIKEKGLSKSYRQKQLVMIGVEAIHATKEDQRDITYKIQRQELEMHRVLLDFAQEINGSMVKNGNGVYVIYTTRGELGLYTRAHSIHELRDEIFTNSKLKVRVGVGYGQTVLESEENIQMALSYARNSKESLIISIDEAKEITEIAADNTSFTYNRRNMDQKLNDALKDAKISPSIVAKIESLSRYYNKEEITSLDLSRWLKSTERNARRILSEMERVGYASASEEESGQRGRPRKIFKLIF